MNERSPFTRTCALFGCPVTFIPKMEKHIYCCPEHGNLAWRRADRIRRRELRAVGLKALDPEIAALPPRDPNLPPLPPRPSAGKGRLSKAEAAAAIMEMRELREKSDTPAFDFEAWAKK